MTAILQSLTSSVNQLSATENAEDSGADQYNQLLVHKVNVYPTQPCILGNSCSLTVIFTGKYH